VPATLRNPIYHWSHLELARYFGIHEILDETTAPGIWDQANSMLAEKDLSTWGILKKMKVKFIGTTDDPIDSLEHHVALKASACPATVAPSFRPDKAFSLTSLVDWNAWTDKLAAVTGNELGRLDEFKSALASRIDFFDSLGCRSSDHGLDRCPLLIASDAEAGDTFQKARCGKSLTQDEIEGFAGNVLAYLAERYAEKGWVMQLHLGAIRSVNAGIHRKLGIDVGCDSINDEQQIPSLALLLGELSLRGALPKTILYNLNPADNYAFATMCGNFFETDIKGKVQLGSGWWFLDQWEGMRWQLNALSSLGLLSNFVGMLTDSRSMMSYPRHEYFRRLLCQLLGSEMENGALPSNAKVVGKMVRNICYANAKSYFA
jgi:glucuronate isomerase